ncbi:MAG: HEAT repeat domain-containing protein [Vulcanimicrobiota bacterium]
MPVETYAENKKVKELSESKITQDKINQIFGLLSSIEPYERQKGERLLNSIVTEEDLNQLVQAARDENFETKYFVIRQLEKFDYDVIVDSLITFLYDDNEVIRESAKRALTGIAREEKYDKLIPLLTSSNKTARIYAIRAFGEGAQANAVLPLMDILGDEDPDIRLEVIDALRFIGDPRAENAAIMKLQDPEPRVRYASAFYCGSRKVNKSCKELHFLLENDEHSRVRSIAAWAIGKTCNKKYMNKMVDHLSSEDNQNVRNEIFKVLKKNHQLENLMDKRKYPPAPIRAQKNVFQIGFWRG